MFPLPEKAIIAMIHVRALPGTPRGGASLDEISRIAVDEARIYADAGVDALMIENMHDTPYLNAAVGPEIVAAMTVVGERVRKAANLPLGVQILAGANREAVAVAHAIGAQFVRVENYVFSHVADEGLMPTADAGPLLRYRRQIGAEGVAVFADIKKKHGSHALTADVPLAETAAAAEFFGADGVIVTGAATGRPTALADVADVRRRVAIPVLVGSGVTADNLAELWPHASGFIVGSAFKYDGKWSNPIDGSRVTQLMRVLQAL